MVFASGLFLFLFFPVVLIGCFFLRKAPIIVQNTFLLIMSIGFYLNSGLRETLLLLLSLAVNYTVARLMCRARKHKRAVLICGLVFNVGILFVFKYLSFLSEQMNRVTSGRSRILAIALPLGISFYTFQAISYLLDVYRNDQLEEKNIINVALYISLFPQLVAGPIVRWESIRDYLRSRVPQIDKGISRFTAGLAKKVILANTMALFADKAFSLLDSGELTTGFAWMGGVAYMLQIYYDFSGYSDMAIGLGHILGFRFPENFDYPYISSSITEFWKRWHISLSSWFRDYVYIPLGGNRCSKAKWIRNLFIVWVCTGVWHGANYTFWLWGLLYFVFLLIEKLCSQENSLKGDNRGGRKTWSVVGHIYTLFVVMLLWIIFRADSLADAWQYIRQMFTRGAQSAYAKGVTWLYLKNGIVMFVIAILGCIPWVGPLKAKLEQGRWGRGLIQALTIALFILSCCVTVDSNYNPFIYFNF